MNIEELCKKITELIRDFDPYEFKNLYDSFDEAVTDTEKSMIKDPESITNYLEGIISHGTEDEGKTASEYIKQTNEVLSSLYSKENIEYSLVNIEGNKNFLDISPNRPFGDIAMTYRVAQETEKGRFFSVKIDNVAMQKLNMTEQDLYEAAMENTPRMHPMTITPIEDVLFGNEDSGDHSIGANMYVITNDLSYNGASAILYPGAAEQIEQKTGDFYILPSSIHEVLAVPKEGADLEAMRRMVYEINRSEVAPEERLSDNVFEIGERGLIIAEDHEKKQEKASVLGKLHANERKIEGAEKTKQPRQKQKTKEDFIE